MKYPLFLFIWTIFAALSVFSQTSRKTPAPPKIKLPAAQAIKSATAGRKSNSGVLNETITGISGVTSLLIPADLSAENNPLENKNFGKLSWVNYQRLWKRASVNDSAWLEIDLRVLNWNNPIKDLALVTTDQPITPDFLIDQELSGDAYDKSQPDSRMKEVGELKISNQRGAFYRAVLPAKKDSFVLGWTTYRYYKDKPQSIYLTISGGNSELEKALKILHSLKIE